MKQHFDGLGNMTKQPQFVPSDTRLARYAAPFYRPIIFVLTCLIFLGTMIKNLSAPLVLSGLFFAIFLYAAFFFVRMRMTPRQLQTFYQPRNQLIRGQINILAVTLIIILLTAHGIYDHVLWLLYVLATLLISEHNKTQTVLLTLVEVAILYILASYPSAEIRLTP